MLYPELDRFLRWAVSYSQPHPIQGCLLNENLSSSRRVRIASERYGRFPISKKSC